MLSFKKIAVILFLVLTLCRGGFAAGTELLISAASSTTDVLKELIVAFELDNPDVHVATNFAGSGTLLRQIERGAPVDLFFSADQLTMNQAVGQGLVNQDEVHNIAENRLIIIGRNDLPYSLVNFESISLPNVKLIAVGNPDSVPAGRYARAALQKQGLWDDVASNLIFTQNVRQCIDYIARGEVDLAFVYATDMRFPREDVDLLLTLDMSEPIIYPIGILKRSKFQGESARFIAFLKSEKAEEIIESFGFSNF
ncbi:molybdate ABC transporter substrate-binding protein [Burkholderiales bacterium]|nr:molybdate ABC transporter substrate-binding protein [Burkholderiales bacterium]